MNEPKPSLSSEDNLPKLPTTPYDDGQFQEGYTAGYGAGYENGYSEGQTAGSDLKLAGYTAGYGAGYENGYSEGQTAGSDLKLAPKIRVTHAENCWSWGPAHYECACRELAKAKGWAK